MSDKTTEPLRILGISGSIRNGSYNTALLHAAAELAPSDVSIIVHDISDVPLYNADLDTDDPPDAVARLKEAIGDVDGVLLATPEYNYGISGVLKNAIDWASRPGYRSVFRHKPVAIFGASGSLVGTARAQAQTKQVLLGMLSHVFPYPEVLVSRAFERFDDEGRLTDESTRKFIAEFVSAASAWVKMMRAASDLPTT